MSAAVALLGAHGEARAQDACISAYEQTQTLRKEGKVREARASAIECAADQCPKALSRDCAKWLAEIDASIPTVVLEARGPDGADLTNVRVLMDGKPLLEKIEGKAVQVEIGSHKFRFEPAAGSGLQALELGAVIHEGERNRKVTVTLKSALASERPVPAGVYLFGGAAIVAFGMGGYFGIRGLAKKGDLDACKPSCPASEVNSMSTSLAVADVAIGVGVVASLAALYMYLSRPVAEPAAPQAATGPAPRLGAGPLPGGAAAAAAWTF